MSYIKLGAISLSLFTVTAFVWASESDELQEKAGAMQRKAAELAEQGHKEEAANLKRKAMAMLEEAEHLDHGGLDQRHPEILRLKALLERIRQKEKYLEGEAGADEALSIAPLPKCLMSKSPARSVFHKILSSSSFSSPFVFFQCLIVVSLSALNEHA